MAGVQLAVAGLLSTQGAVNLAELNTQIRAHCSRQHWVHSTDFWASSGFGGMEELHDVQAARREEEAATAQAQARMDKQDAAGHKCTEAMQRVRGLLSKLTVAVAADGGRWRFKAH